MNNKYNVYIDNELFVADGLGYEYSQLDGEGAGRGDDFTMIRDVGGLNNKIYLLFNDKNRWYGEELSRLLKLSEVKECDFRYFDAKEYDWITKNCYLTVSKAEVTLIDGETYPKDNIEVHLIQMDVDNI